MLQGPILGRELIAQARKRGGYRDRALYGLLLLALAWSRYEAAVVGDGYLSVAEAARSAQLTTYVVLLAQLGLMLVMVPASTADIIAGERRRGTLRDLLATPLSGPSIVAGKLTARLIRLGSQALVGLPVLALMGLFGGVEPTFVSLAYAATFTTAFLVGSAAALISVHSRGPREAVLATYGLELIWLIVPVRLFAWGFGGMARPWWDPAIAWVLATSPLALLLPSSLIALMAQGPRALDEVLARMIGTQLAIGLVLTLVAGLRLRGVERRGWAGSIRRRAWSRPAVDEDDPMGWKERFAPGVARIPWLAWAGFGLIVSVWGLEIYQELRLSRLPNALRELAWHGYDYGPGGIYAESRHRLAGALADMTAGLFAIVLVLVAASAAVGVTLERERDTWTALLLTPLEPAAIVRAKVASVLDRHRYLGLLILAPGLVGVLIGATHPLGLLPMALTAYLYLRFAAELATWISLRSKGTSSALTTTLAALIGANLSGYLLFGLGLPEAWHQGWFLGFSPYLVSSPLVSNHTTLRLGTAGPSVLGIVLIVAGNALIFGYLTWRLRRDSERQFDAIADRPRRPVRPVRLGPRRLTLPRAAGTAGARP